jgi:hypothetical protein
MARVGAAPDTEPMTNAPHTTLLTVELATRLRNLAHYFRAQSARCRAHASQTDTKFQIWIGYPHRKNPGPPHDSAQVNRICLPDRFPLRLHIVPAATGRHEGNSNHGNGKCGDQSGRAASCSSLVGNFERKDAGICFFADGRESLADKEKFVGRDLASIEPITHRRGADAHGASGGGGAPQGFDNGFNCGKHGPT